MLCAGRISSILYFTVEDCEQRKRCYHGHSWPKTHYYPISNYSITTIFQNIFLRVAPVLLPQIYPDPELEQQILALAIRCIHSEEGCRWTGQMKQLQVKSFNILSSLIKAYSSCCRPPPPTSPFLVFWKYVGGFESNGVSMIISTLGPLLHLRLQRNPLPQSLLRQADAPRLARPPAARLPQAQGQVRVLWQRVHRRSLRGKLQTSCVSLCFHPAFLQPSRILP